MRKKITILVCMLCLLNVSSLLAQCGDKSGTCVPVKTGNSALYYGNDVLVNDQPSQNQRNACITVAYNGWLYSAYTYNTSSTYGFVIMKSTNSGLTWTTFTSFDFGSSAELTAIDIVAAGNTASDFKVFVAGVRHNIGSNYIAFVDRYDPTTGTFENEIMNENWDPQIWDIKIATDYLYPSYGANPYSLGILYSESAAVDALIFQSSADGGATVSNKIQLTLTPKFCYKLALSFGLSNTWENGKYFAAWEEINVWPSGFGHIYTAHSNAFFDGPFTHKICLDTLTNDGNIINSCRNPSISTMFNTNIDNANSDLTEIVLFDRMFTSTDIDVLGMVNEYAPSSTENAHWVPFEVDNSYNSSMESDINYDPVYNNFLVTYFDSTSIKLPYLIHHLDMSQPDNWIPINPGYNDLTNLVNPFPKVEINSTYGKVANVWVGERPTGHGAVQYDAEYVTGISEQHQSALAKLEGAYPNPCNTTTNIQFDLTLEQTVNVQIYNTFGQMVSDITQNYTIGKHDMLVNVSSLPSGCYYYRFTAGDYTASGTIAVAR